MEVASGWRIRRPATKGAQHVKTQLVNRRRLRALAAIGGLTALVAGVGAAAGALPFSPSEGTATAYVSVSPQRVLDTRSGIGAPIGKVSSLTLSFADVASVPDEARAVVLTLTATEGTEDSYLSVQPSGAPDKSVSNVNFLAGRAVANQVTVLLGTNSSLYITNAFGQVHLVADLAGYYIDLPDTSSPGPQGEPGLNGTNGVEGPDGTIDGGGNKGRDNALLDCSPAFACK